MLVTLALGKPKQEDDKALKTNMSLSGARQNASQRYIVRAFFTKKGRWQQCSIYLAVHLPIYKE